MPKRELNISVGALPFPVTPLTLSWRRCAYSFHPDEHLDRSIETDEKLPPSAVAMKRSCICRFVLTKTGSLACAGETLVIKFPTRRNDR